MPTHPAEAAIHKFWGAKDSPSSRAISSAYRAIIEAVTEELVRAGIDPTTIHAGHPLPLPGAYQNPGRPWDIVVLEADMPVAVIDIKLMFSSIRKTSVTGWTTWSRPAPMSPERSSKRRCGH